MWDECHIRDRELIFVPKRLADYRFTEHKKKDSEYLSEEEKSH